MRSKETIKAEAIARMQIALRAQEWSVREKIALTCRILFELGHDAGLSGQITARAGSNGFVTQRLGLGLDEITVSNLLTVDDELRAIEGEGMPNPANRFHGWIYRARPDVSCIVHTHPLHVAALSMLEVPLVISHMDCCILHDQVAMLSRWPGIPVGDAEGELITAALGKRNVVLLTHHGMVVVGGSVEEACVIALQMERAAQLQLLAMAAGEIRPVDPLLAAEARDWVLQPKRIQATFAYYARRVLGRDAACLR